MMKWRRAPPSIESHGARRAVRHVEAGERRISSEENGDAMLAVRSSRYDIRMRHAIIDPRN